MDPFERSYNPDPNKQAVKKTEQKDKRGLFKQRGRDTASSTQKKFLDAVQHRKDSGIESVFYNSKGFFGSSKTYKKVHDAGGINELIDEFNEIMASAEPNMLLCESVIQNLEILQRQIKNDKIELLEELQNRINQMQGALTSLRDRRGQEVKKLQSDIANIKKEDLLRNANHAINILENPESDESAFIEHIKQKQSGFKRTGKDEPKAGFEMEWVGTYIYKDNPDGHKSAAHRYSKRDVIFKSQHGTWQGTADSTSEACSNLELIIGPQGLPMDFWCNQEDKVYVEEMKELEDFVRWIESLDIGKDIRLSDYPNINKFSFQSDAIIHKKNTRELEIQMTAADFQSNSEVPPDWWPSGLNYSAYPQIKKTIAAFLSGPLEGANPKTIFNGFILKTPLLHILGHAKPALSIGKQTEWVSKMIEALGLEEQADIAIDRGALSKYKPSTWIQVEPMKFTWRQYLTGLIRGADLIRDWARIAFGGVEDMGYGQIPDADLSDNWAIIEYRHGPQFQSFQSRAMKWAKEEAAKRDEWQKKSQKTEK